MSGDVELPPCVLCGKPGIMGVGWSGEPDDEAWYCLDHIDAGFEHAAEPIKRARRELS